MGERNATQTTFQFVIGKMKALKHTPQLHLAAAGERRRMGLN
jgi:hypothetical protein